MKSMMPAEVMLSTTIAFSFRNLSFNTALQSENSLAQPSQQHIFQKKAFMIKLQAFYLKLYNKPKLQKIK